MKISVLKDFNHDDPENMIICLSGYNKSDLSELIICIEKTLKDGFNILSSEHFISETQCKIILRLSLIDEGFKELSKNTYECFLSENNYKSMIELIKPFRDQRSSENAYQWLYDLNSNIEFLLSNNGKW